MEIKVCNMKESNALYVLIILVIKLLDGLIYQKILDIC